MTPRSSDPSCCTSPVESDTLAGIVAQHAREVDPGARPVVLTVPCATLGQHELGLLCDWSVSAPHDLDAERVATSLGSPVSPCVDVVDRVLPSFRRFVELRRRTVLPPVDGSTVGSWRVVPSAPCCVGRPFGAAGQALEHARSVDHLKASLGTAFPLLDAALVGVGGDSEGTDRYRRFCSRVASGQCVPPIALPALWNAGLAPGVVCRVHRALGAPIPLPMNAYLAAVGSGARLGWVRQAAAGSDDGHVYHWLLETETALDRADPEVRPAWMRTPVRRGAIPLLSAQGYTAEDLERLTADAGLRSQEAAEALATWAEQGMRPSVGDLAALCRAGIPPVPRGDLSEARVMSRRLQAARHAVTLTDLVLIAAAAGSLAAAELRIRGGARRLADVLT